MELREAAIAYYNNGPEDLKQRAYDFFKEMDMEGNGKISSFEFMEFLQQAGYRLYFTCVECFECAGGDTYDFCLSCCRIVFLDNFIMLLSRRQPPMAPPSNILVALSLSLSLSLSLQLQLQLQLQLHQTQTRSWSGS
ncbi:hypothetical protein Patl1_25720 [Pistacia atlantica]|uniref:Uncharacterized protein n=1 Tax=Pistacia atlantica TaxID=434234 RepID=A0ACC1AZY1_9ROSI|nr:hypothetical protein Patl1_25720 [Pistacia atlantica]